MDGGDWGWCGGVFDSHSRLNMTVLPLLAYASISTVLVICVRESKAKPQLTKWGLLTVFLCGPFLILIAVAIMPIALAYQLRNPTPCRHCANYYGEAHGHDVLVCAMHPYGKADRVCPDFV